MNRPLFVTGIGTGVGKTLVSAILAEALHADYWKPVQAGYENGTDSQWVRSVVGNTDTVVHPERYIFKTPVSPHIAARGENVEIRLDAISTAFLEIRKRMPPDRLLIIEGAGGLMVPLSENCFVADLVASLEARTVIVSRNYLGSINHSLLTAQAVAARGITGAGWIFNDQYLAYEDEIVRWSAIPKISVIPYCYQPDKNFVASQAKKITGDLRQWIHG